MVVRLSTAALRALSCVPRRAAWLLLAWGGAARGLTPANCAHVCVCVNVCVCECVCVCVWRCVDQPQPCGCYCYSTARTSETLWQNGLNLIISVAWSYVGFVLYCTHCLETLLLLLHHHYSCHILTQFSKLLLMFTKAAHARACALRKIHMPEGWPEPFVGVLYTY